jgi:peroxiredoxin Q/BCP
MRRSTGAGVLASLACLGLAAAAPPVGALEVGDRAPAFEARDDAGNPWRSSDHVGGKIVVVYFYPADFTGGCTKQACGFRDGYQRLAERGVLVVGVSGDSAATHALFKKEHGLPFALLADEDGAIARQFGVPTRAGGEVEVEVGGRPLSVERRTTAARWTFVIGRDGTIVHKQEKVDPGDDAERVLRLVESLEPAR